MIEGWHYWSAIKKLAIAHESWSCDITRTSNNPNNCIAHNVSELIHWLLSFKSCWIHSRTLVCWRNTMFCAKLLSIFIIICCTFATIQSTARLKVRAWPYRGKMNDKNFWLPGTDEDNAWMMFEGSLVKKESVVAPRRSPVKGAKSSMEKYSVTRRLE